MNVAVALLATMRPRQWVKNVFVLAPLVFAVRGTHVDLVVKALLAAVLYSLVSGIVYIVNDVLDCRHDANHPEKRHRPIASGRLSISTAMWAAVTGAAGIVTISFWWHAGFAWVVTGYLVVNVLYSLLLKQLPGLDVVIIATGFLLRVVAGALVIDVEISSWILATSFLLALFLGLGKRVHEAQALSGHGVRTRQVLDSYRGRNMSTVFGVTGVCCGVLYSAYTVSERALHSFGHPWLSVTIPFVALGLWRFHRLSVASTTSKSPTDALLSDPISLLAALGFAVGSVWAIYLR